MGRFPSIAASKQKTGAAKAKVYSMYAREIYQVAKTGGTEIDSNLSLRRLVEKAREEQVPSDIIKRAIDKVNSGSLETYQEVRYELFGPSGSNFIVECLTDNVNRSVSSLRAALNKTSVKMGNQGSVTFMYDHNAVIGVANSTEEIVLEHLINASVEVEDMEAEGDTIVVYGEPTNLYEIKEALNDLKVVASEIVWIPKETVTLNDEEKEIVKKLLMLLDDIEDVQNVYHNVKDI